VDIRNKHLLITGGGRRIGRVLALDAASRGARITIHYRSGRDEAEETVAEIARLGSAAVAVRAELTSAAEVRRLVDSAVQAFGPLDALYASAAVFRKTPWKTLDEKAWTFHLDSNLTAVFLLVKEVESRMNDGGVIVTFGDWSATRPYRNYLPYTVSKAGVVALTKALAQELAPRLRVNCICPSTVLPPEDVSEALLATIAERTPLGRIGSPEDVAAAVRFLVEETDFATGSIVTIDGGRLVADPGCG
jgi:pteridine reductase